MKNLTITCSRILLTKKWNLLNKFVHQFSRPKLKSLMKRLNWSLAPNANCARNSKHKKTFKLQPSTQAELSSSQNSILSQLSYMEITCTQNGHHKFWPMLKKKWVMTRLKNSLMNVSLNCSLSLRRSLSIDISILCLLGLSLRLSKKARKAKFLKKLLITSVRSYNFLWDFCHLTLLKLTTDPTIFLNSFQSYVWMKF